MRVLLLTSVFPPINATGSRRPYYLARQLRDSGHQVTVLTNERPEKHPWVTDLEGLERIALPLTHLPIYLNDPQRALAGSLHAMQRVGMNTAARWLADLLLPLDHGSRWALDDRTIMTLTGEQDIVIATGPRWSMFERGRALARAWSATFIADYRDPWNLALPEVGLRVVTHVGTGLTGRLRQARRMRHERSIVAGANAITAATPTVLENAMRITGNRRGTVIFNGLEPTVPTTASARNDKFTIVYTGSAYREQEWSLMARSIELLNSDHPHIAATSRLLFIGTSANDDPMLAPLREILDRAPLVEVLARAEPNAIHAFQRTADALLHVGFLDKQGILPLKLIEYLGCPPPIWQISTGTSIQEDLIESSNAGAVLRTPRSIVDHWVDQHTAWRNGTTLQPTRNPEVIAKFHWSHQMSLFERFMMETYHAHRSGNAPKVAR